jgi:DNA-binding transcriptional MocR family regulator
MWCVPVFSNPTGVTFAWEKVRRLVQMRTAAPDFRLFWDNAYVVHHLTPERVRIANIDEACVRHGNPNRAFIFGSTSKMTLAGSGFGLFGGSKDNVAWYVKRMEKRTIGGDKVNQLRHVRLLQNAQGIDRLMDRHREIIAPKFAQVRAAFDSNLADTGVARWNNPRGGYFVTLDVMDGCAKQVVKLAKEAGVELTPAGATHPLGNDPRDSTLRIAPTFPEPTEIAQAAEGVAVCVLLAATEKLLVPRDFPGH